MSSRLVIWLCAALLILANVIVLLPSRLTVALFVPTAMGLASLEVAQIERDTGVVLIDASGEIVHSGMATRWPNASIQSHLRSRRIEHLLRHARIAVFARPADGEESVYIGDWAAKEVWRPEGELPLRFELPRVLELPPGRYEVSVTLYAESPWGSGSPEADGVPELVNQLYARPVLPGQFILETDTVSEMFVVTGAGD